MCIFSFSFEWKKKWYWDKLCSVVVKRMASNSEVSLAHYLIITSPVHHWNQELIGLWEALNEIVKQHKCWGVHMWLFMYMCVHTCGGQKSILGVVPQGLLALLFETCLSLGLGTCQLEEASWRASSRHLPASTSSARRLPASARMHGFWWGIRPRFSCLLSKHFTSLSYPAPPPPPNP